MNAGSQTLTTARLVLRPAVLDDQPELLATGEAADAARVQRLHALIERNPIQFALHGYGLWVIHHGSRSVGWIGLRPRESAIDEAGFTPLANLWRRRDEFETWSQFVLEELAK